MYLRDYPEGGRHGLQPATRRGHIDDIDMAKSVNPSAITTEAVDAPSIVIFDLDQYVHVMLVQTDVHRNAKAKRSSSNLILLGPV
jgi:hypothetical protein